MSFKKLWSVENGANTVVAVGVDVDTEGTATNSAIEIGNQRLTDTAIAGMQQTGTAIEGGETNQLLTRTSTTTLGWVDRSEVGTQVSASSEKQASVTTTLGSITVAGSTFNIPDSVVANPEDLSSEAENLTGLRVAGEDFKIAPVEANPTTSITPTQTLQTVKIDNTIYKVSNPTLENAIENKGIGYVSEEADLISWDGDTTDKYKVDFSVEGTTISIYKVSDKMPNIKNMIGHLYVPDGNVSFTLAESDVEDYSEYYDGLWMAEKEIEISDTVSLSVLIISLENDISDSWFGDFKKGFYMNLASEYEGSSTEIMKQVGGTITTPDETEYFVTGDSSSYESAVLGEMVGYKIFDEGIPFSQAIGLSFDGNMLYSAFSDELYNVDVTDLLSELGITDPRGLEGTVCFDSDNYVLVGATITSPAEEGTPALPTQTGFYTFKGITGQSSMAGYYLNNIYFKPSYAKIEQKFLPDQPVIGYTGTASFTFSTDSTSTSCYFSSLSDTDTILIYPSSRDYKTAMDDANIYISQDGSYVYMYRESSGTSLTIGVNYSIIKTIVDPND